MAGKNAIAKAPAGLKKVVVASMAGTVVEWYEFFLYSTAVTLVFGKYFFPNAATELDGIIDGFATYAVGFIARPLGGIVFGHFGDKFGRKKLLQFSLILVGVSTFLMGCLPGFNTHIGSGHFGYWAPALLVVMRFVQGFAVGGEWGGGALLIAEHSPNKDRGFWASWTQSGVPAGNLLATAVLLILSATLSEDQFIGWGWRVAFWLSAIIVLIGYYIRTKIDDAPIFVESRKLIEQNKEVSYGLVEVFKRYPRGVFTAMGLRYAENVIYYLVTAFSVTYLSAHLKMDTSNVLYLLLLANVVHFCLVLWYGHLADVLGRKPVYIAGAIAGGVWAFYAFPMMNTQNDFVIFLAIVLGLASHGLMYAGQPAIMAEMFPTRMRYSGVSLGYQVTSIVAGSISPMIATALLGKFNSSVPIGIYMAAAAIITLVACFFARETKGIALEDIDEADRQAVARELGARSEDLTE